MTTSPDLTPPPPRRSDDAFVRAVSADVAAARTARAPWRMWLAAPATAAAALGLVLLARETPAPLTTPTAEHLTALVEAEADAEDDRADAASVIEAIDIAEDDALVALAGSGDAPAFAFAALDGSTEQDLAAVEAALDRALARL